MNHTHPYHHSHKNKQKITNRPIRPTFFTHIFMHIIFTVLITTLLTTDITLHAAQPLTTQQRQEALRVLVSIMQKPIDIHPNNKDANDLTKAIDKLTAARILDQNLEIVARAHAAQLAQGNPAVRQRIAALEGQLQAQHATLTQQQQQAQQDIQKLQQQLTDTQTQLAQAQQQPKLPKAPPSPIIGGGPSQQDIDALQARIRELDQALQTSNADVLQLQAQNADLQQQATTRLEQIENQAQMVGQYQEQNKQLKKQTEQLLSENARLLDNQKIEAEHLLASQKTITMRDESLAVAEAKRAELEQNLAASRITQKSLAENNKKLRDELAAKPGTEQTQRLLAQIQDLNAKNLELTQSAARTESLDAELKKVRDELAQKRVESQQAQASGAVDKMKNLTLTTKIHKLNQQMRQEVEASSTEIARLQRENSELKQRLSLLGEGLRGRLGGSTPAPKPTKEPKRPIFSKSVTEPLLPKTRELEEESKRQRAIGEEETFEEIGLTSPEEFPIPTTSEEPQSEAGWASKQWGKAKTRLKAFRRPGRSELEQPLIGGEEGGTISRQPSSQHILPPQTPAETPYSALTPPISATGPSQPTKKHSKPERTLTEPLIPKVGPPQGWDPSLTY